MLVRPHWCRYSAWSPIPILRESLAIPGFDHTECPFTCDKRKYHSSATHDTGATHTDKHHLRSVIIHCNSKCRSATPLQHVKRLKRCNFWSNQHRRHMCEPWLRTFDTLKNMLTTTRCIRQIQDADHVPALGISVNRVDCEREGAVSYLTRMVSCRAYDRIWSSVKNSSPICLEACHN